ncbi:MAG: HypC/HybG/HupF family hydrogenase formation chaperone [Terriglobales bacterium]
MCLAIPGKVLEEFEQRGMRTAKVQFGGIVREASLDYVPDAKVGDYVLVTLVSQSAPCCRLSY